MYTSLYTTFNNWLHNVPTDYRLDSLVQLPQQLVKVYRLHSPVHLLQQLVSECTYRYRLHSPVHLLQQLVTECMAGTGYTALHTCFNLLVTKSTNRVLATQSLLYSSSPWLHIKKKKIYIYIYIDQ